VVVLVGLNDAYTMNPDAPGNAGDVGAGAPVRASPGFFSRLKTVQVARALYARARGKPPAPGRVTGTDDAPSAFERDLRAIADLLAGRRVPLVLVDYPLPTDTVVPHMILAQDLVGVRRATRAVSAAAGVPLVTPQAAFAKYKGDDVFHPMYHTHPSALGYRVLATEVARAVLATGVLPIAGGDLDGRAMGLAAGRGEGAARPSLPAAMLDSFYYKTVRYDVARGPDGSVREVTADCNGDGRVDYRARYENGRIAQVHRLAAFSMTMKDTRTARYVYDGDALVRIEETISGADGRPERVVRHLKDGVLTGAEFDADGDGRFERVEEYPEAGVTVTRTDADGDGTFEHREVERPDGSIEHVFDEDGNGVFEKYELRRGGRLVEKKADLDQDGTFDLFYTLDDAGRIVSARGDLNHDGRDDVGEEYRDGVRVRTVRDADGDGEFDHWTDYDARGRTARVERRIGTPAGVRREVETYKDGVLAETAIDENGDGKVDAKDVRPSPGVLEKLRDDDGNGVFEQYERYANSRLAEKKVDVNQDGRWALRFVLDGEGTILSAHADLNGDGRDDYWETYRDGKLTASEKDRNFDGKPDQWITFDPRSGTKHVRVDDDHEKR
jgi:hypothetical protein